MSDKQPPPTFVCVAPKLSLISKNMKKISEKKSSSLYKSGTRRSRHCATSQKVAGSIPDGVIAIFHWHNPSGPHCGPGVDSASNRNEYQEFFLGGKGGRCVGLTTLPLSCADCLEIWEPQTPGTLWACPEACTGIACCVNARGGGWCVVCSECDCAMFDWEDYSAMRGLIRDTIPSTFKFDDCRLEQH